MSEIQWGLLNPVDTGALAQQGFATGMALVKHVQTQNALKAYLANPDNPQAFGALASIDPQTATTLQDQRTQQMRVTEATAERQRQQRQATLEAHRDNIVKGAAILRQFNPQDDASWQQALAAAHNAGVDVSEVPPHFDPNYRDQLLKTADALEPPKAAEMPNVAKEAAYYRSIGRPDLAEKLLVNHAEGPPIGISNGNGTTTLYPRSYFQGGGDAPAPAAPAPAPSSGTFTYQPTPGAQETSGYRTPQHNREVGGVPNSYHTRTDAAGHPLAHDFVPPAGMSMNQLYADMRARNPGLDVINEGDHVHIEPRVHMAPGGHGGPVHVTSVDDYSRLPKGTPYIDPNGVHRVKS